MNNDKGLLKPGQYVKMFITSAKARSGMIVPEKSIVQAEGDSFVYVVTDGENGSVAKKRKVTLGETFDGKQVILDGINKGDKVMVGGLSNRMLFDGSRVNIVTEK